VAEGRGVLLFISAFQHLSSCRYQNQFNFDVVSKIRLFIDNYIYGTAMPDNKKQSHFDSCGLKNLKITTRLILKN